MSGKITGDQKLALTIGFQSTSLEDRNVHETEAWAQPRVRQAQKEKEYSTEIVVNVRGGKQLRIPVGAKTVVPDLFIEEPVIDFGGVTFGDQKVMPITIYNRSDVTAKLILDIREYPEFEIIVPDPHADDDIHSEIMVPIHEHPKYEDILN